jgi:hypothetical protein
MKELIELFRHRTAQVYPDAGYPLNVGYIQELNDAGRNGRLEVRAEALGLPKERYARPSPCLSPIDVRWAEDVVSLCGDKPLILLFPQTNYMPRQWPAPYWVELAWMLNGQGFAPVVVLGHHDARFTNVPFHRIAQPWSHVAALMQRASLVIGNDSAPAHLAGTLNVPTFALCGPTYKKVFEYMPSVQVVTAPHELRGCVGCHWKQDRGYRAACDQGCMALYDVRVEHVARLVEERVRCFGKRLEIRSPPMPKPEFTPT